MKVFKKLFLSCMTLVFLIITFASTTYAWFKINSSAAVEGFDFEIQGGMGFVVSADGKNYKNSISSKEIKQLIIQGLDDELYQLIDGKLINQNTQQALSESQMDEVISERVLLMPLTSHDGIALTDLYNASSTGKSGRFVEFSIYFKCASDYLDDGLVYDIYLNGEDQTDERTGATIPATSITSAPTSVSLKAPMTLGDGTMLSRGDKIQVYSSNALRMSVQDTSSDSPKATIFELSDESDKNLGSYATDYNKETDTSDLSEEEKDILDRLYNADKNAMFTYYNNLRTSSKLNKMKYEEMPQTVKSLAEEATARVTTVKSGFEANLLTFRFWLEGWDADCFDGLANSISVKLSFTSKRVYD